MRIIIYVFIHACISVHACSLLIFLVFLFIYFTKHGIEQTAIVMKRIQCNGANKKIITSNTN